MGFECFEDLHFEFYPDFFLSMKLLFALICGLSATAFVGCGKKESAAGNGGSAATAPVPSGPRQIVISGGDTMKFDVTSIEAAPGEDLVIVFKNVGSVPKEAMGHNLVVLAKGVDVAAFSAAAMAAKSTDYVPANLSSQVVAHSKLLGPKQSDSLKFKAPMEPGEYPYVCSFPGHVAAGMKGVLIVK